MPFQAEVKLSLAITGAATPLAQNYTFPVGALFPGSPADIPKAEIKGLSRNPGMGKIYLGGVSKERLTCLLIAATTEKGSAYEIWDCGKPWYLQWNLSAKPPGKGKDAESGFEPMGFPRFYDKATKEALPNTLEWVSFKNFLDVPVKVSFLLGYDLPDPPADQADTNDRRQDPPQI